MTDGLTKVRINRLEAQIKEAGLTAPDFSAIDDLDKKEDLLRDFWNTHKDAPRVVKSEPVAPAAAAPPPAQDLGETTDKEALQKMQEEMDGLKQALAKVLQNQSSGGITMEALEKLLDKQSAGKISENMVREGYVPPGEALPEPVIFWTPQQNDYLSFRYEGGMVVLPPHGLKWIKFENRFRWTVRSGDTYKVRAISAYICRSKPVYDFILKHHKFNNTIFLDSTKAIGASEHSEWMQNYTRFYAALVNTQDVRLPKLAASYGLPTGVDTLPDKYRELIAEAQTKQFFEQLRQGEEEFRRERQEDSMITATAR